jgi:membrane protease YdiL (CAAX protease family)
VPEPRSRVLARALAAAAGVTLLVTVASAVVPDRYVATVVGAIFFGAAWLLVMRFDDAEVQRAGLAFGGSVLRGPFDRARLIADSWRAVALALVMAIVVFGPFYAGWRVWAEHVWHIHGRFHFMMKPAVAVNDALGQLIIIALPEEVFYRGYLQTRLDDVWSPRLRILGASVGPGLVVTSVVFALGHLATQRDPARLAVFFPSLLFGWLRARTGGVGASVVFHAMCNLFSEMLMRGYGVH